jgi:galacturan 1,4-alpha-galacturonidase
MVTSGDAARIKVYGGIPPTSTSLTSGGGTGFIRNVTYHTIIDQADNCKFPCLSLNAL